MKSTIQLSESAQQTKGRKRSKSKQTIKTNDSYGHQYITHFLKWVNARLNLFIFFTFVSCYSPDMNGNIIFVIHSFNTETDKFKNSWNIALLTSNDIDIYRYTCPYTKHMLLVMLYADKMKVAVRNILYIMIKICSAWSGI